MPELLAQNSTLHFLHGLAHTCEALPKGGANDSCACQPLHKSDRTPSIKHNFLYGKSLSKLDYVFEDGVLINDIPAGQFQRTFAVPALVIRRVPLAAPGQILGREESGKGYLPERCDFLR